MKKRKKMKPFTGWATVTDFGRITWHDGKAVGVYASHAEARMHVIETEGDRIVRVRITEAPKKRAKCRSKKP